VDLTAETQGATEAAAATAAEVVAEVATTVEATTEEVVAVEVATEEVATKEVATEEATSKVSFTKEVVVVEGGAPVEETSETVQFSFQTNTPESELSAKHVAFASKREETADNTLYGAIAATVGAAAIAICVTLKKRQDNKQVIETSENLDEGFLQV